MSKKKKTLVVMLVLMGVAVLGLAAAVYAKYIASLTADGGTATVAVWKFEDENSGNGVVNCELTGTYNANTLVNGKIAPGTTGRCTIVVKNLQSEVGVSYKIKLGDITNAPANLVFKNGSTELSSSSEITGTLNINASDTVYIDWEWPYSTSNSNDAKDTTDGKAAKTMTIKFNIEGVQVNPAA